MNKTILLHNPRCRKSREAINFLTHKKIDFEMFFYIIKGLKKSFIKELLEKLSMKPIDLVRNQETIWKEDYKSKKLSNDEIIFILHKYPNLIKRPIVIINNKAIIAIPPSEIIKIQN